MVELFAGVGGFRLGFEKTGEWETVWGNQWEPNKSKQHAFDCYQSHFPNGIACNEDISKVDAKNIPDMSLLVGGFPCFTKGTLITTKEGLIPIEEIQEGDYVLTHQNRYRKVLKTMKRQKQGIYKLNVQGSPSTLVTEEHPYYVRTRSYSYFKNEKGKSQKKEIWSEPQWKDVKDLTKDDYILLATSPLEENPLDLTVEQCWLIGRYVADGYIQDGKRANRKNSYNYKTVFCIGKEKIENFREHVTSYHVTESPNETVIKCIISNKELMELCKEGGKGVHHKKVPSFVFHLPKEYIHAFLEGYFSGDGSIIDGVQNATTVSKELAYGLGQLIHKAYDKPYRIYYQENEEKTTIEGREVSQSPTWIVRYHRKEMKTTQVKYIDKNWWTPLRSLEFIEEYDDFVYNFEVEEDNSYVAHNCVVHNCQDYSVARTQANGINGKKGVLFWDIKRILEEKNPPFVLLENVDRLLKSPSKKRGRDFGIMLSVFWQLGYQVEWRVLNAADYGFPQKRRRIFIFASKVDHPYTTSLQTHTNQDILHTYGFFQSAFPVEEESSVKHPATYSELEEDLIHMTDHFSATFRNSGIMRDGKVYSEELIPIQEKQVNLGDILEWDVDEKYFLSEESFEKWNYLKGAKSIERKTKDGFAYTYSEGKMAFPDHSNAPGRTILTSEGARSRTSHVVEDPKTKRLRILTPVECERLNGFDDNWTNTGMPERFRYFCMGNALVVGLIERMAKKLHHIVDTY